MKVKWLKINSEMPGDGNTFCKGHSLFTVKGEWSVVFMSQQITVIW
jgi:hypothetical protein